ncbi:MAG: 2-phosphosulfolactate phosphatase [Thermoproteota archaeon]|nr:2-phosphosulfolactate phosphatase [Thermoproteota archaeon]
MDVNVEFWARDTKNAVKRGDVVIIIDVLRCSSSIIAALASGVGGIVPIKTVREAREVSRIHPEFILSGERKGVKPSGFKYGNSPVAFSKIKLEGAYLILTTTSGTNALSQAKEAKHVLVGGFLNAKSIAETAYNLAIKESEGITLALSGKKGSFSLEDFLGAGAIIGDLPDEVTLSDAAQAALLAFRGAKSSLTEVVKQGNHAKYLVSIGFEEDIRFSTQLNKYKIIPYLKGEVVIPSKST